jgi:hypothetical protein
MSRAVLKNILNTARWHQLDQIDSDRADQFWRLWQLWRLILAIGRWQLGQIWGNPARYYVGNEYAGNGIGASQLKSANWNLFKIGLRSIGSMILAAT